MALPTTNLRISDVQAAIGATTNNLSQLCTHSNINMFSFEKPGRLIVNWDNHSVVYDKPSGGSSDPYKLGDFRGYEHNSIGPYLASGSNLNIEIPYEDSYSGNRTVYIAYQMPYYDINTYLGTGTTLQKFYGRALDNVGTVVDQNWTENIVQGTKSVPLSVPYNLPNAGDSVQYTLKAALCGLNINYNEPVNWVYLPTKDYYTIQVAITREVPGELRALNVYDGGLNSNNNPSASFKYGDDGQSLQSPIPDYYDISVTNTSIGDSYQAFDVPHSNLSNPIYNVLLYQFSDYVNWTKPYNLSVQVTAKKAGYYNKTDSYAEYVS